MKEKLSRTDLWVNQWVTVDFACRSDKKPSMCSFRQPKHIPGTQERCFDRLDRVVLKVYNNIRNSCNAEANVENICKYIYADVISMGCAALYNRDKLTL